MRNSKGVFAELNYVYSSRRDPKFTESEVVILYFSMSACHDQIGKISRNRIYKDLECSTHRM
jgi:hypothetical protein